MMPFANLGRIIWLPCNGSVQSLWLFLHYLLTCCCSLVNLASGSREKTYWFESGNVLGRYGSWLLGCCYLETRNGKTWGEGFCILSEQKDALVIFTDLLCLIITHLFVTYSCSPHLKRWLNIYFHGYQNLMINDLELTIHLWFEYYNLIQFSYLLTFIIRWILILFFLKEDESYFVSHDTWMNLCYSVSLIQITQFNDLLLYFIFLLSPIPLKKLKIPLSLNC